MLEFRPADPADEDALAELDRATWSTLTTPSPPPRPGETFFDERTAPDDVLVIVDGGAIAGYVRLARATALEASDHVLVINGFVVDPTRRRRGYGRLLLSSAIAEAKRRGARRLTLRVLGHNEAARRLYESAGFVVEGTQRDEFFLDGRYVDDVLMAFDLTAAVS